MREPDSRFLVWGLASRLTRTTNSGRSRPMSSVGLGRQLRGLVRVRFLVGVLDVDSGAAHTGGMTQRRRYTAIEAEAMSPDERKALTTVIDPDDPVAVKMLARGRERLAERLKQYTS